MDSLILALHTRAAHWVQRTFGPTSYLLAQQCIAVVSLAYVMVLANYWLRVLAKPTVILELPLGGIAILVAAVAFVQCGAADRHWRATLTPTVAESFAMRFWAPWVRMLALVLVTVTVPATAAAGRLVDVLFLCALASQLPYSYLVAVVPLPPGESRVARAWRRLTSRPQVLAPSEGR